MSEAINSSSTHSREEMVRGLVAQIGSYIEQYHGGSAEMISLEGDELKVRLGGACVGCPLSTSTLQGWGWLPAFDIHTARMGGRNNQSVFP
jgi:Fe-S cluster biogenesis protein NfuA